MYLNRQTYKQHTMNIMKPNKLNEGKCLQILFVNIPNFQYSYSVYFVSCYSKYVHSSIAYTFLILSVISQHICPQHPIFGICEFVERYFLSGFTYKYLTGTQTNFSSSMWYSVRNSLNNFAREIITYWT